MFFHFQSQPQTLRKNNNTKQTTIDCATDCMVCIDVIWFERGLYTRFLKLYILYTEKIIV